MTDADFRAMFLAAVAAFENHGRREAAARFCRLWTDYRRWFRTEFLPTVPQGLRREGDENSVWIRPVALKARALGFEHALGAVLMMARNCGHGSRRGTVGGSATCGSSRQRGREGVRGGSASLATSRDGDDTLSR